MSGGLRVRFAPSPTGQLHLGGARTALFNYLFARANEGSLVLRIEDTDKERYVPGSVQKLEDTLDWLGIRCDEGPSIGGRFAPYFQSERLHHYQCHAQYMLRNGSAYPCFCSKERLESLRYSGTFGYDGHCRRLTERQVEENLSMGLPHTIRLKVPEEGHTLVSDLVYGDVNVKNITIEDQVLLKTDGYPTYHLAHVVDDHIMEISHVMRGEEKGYLPEAVINFIALMGWYPHTNQNSPMQDTISSSSSQFSAHELLSLDDLIAQFSLEGLNRRSVTVGSDKLFWMNKQHFKRRLKNVEELEKLVFKLQEELYRYHKTSSRLVVHNADHKKMLSTDIEVEGHALIMEQKGL